MSIFAWRYWWAIPNKFNAAQPPDKSILQGMCNVHWPVNQPLHAHCINPRKAHGEGVRLPYGTCQCGIYSLKQPNSEFTWPGYFSSVLGIVEIWGKIITAELGYRSEVAQLRALVSAPAHVANTYSVPNLSTVEYATKEFFG